MLIQEEGAAVHPRHWERAHKGLKLKEMPEERGGGDGVVGRD